MNSETLVVKRLIPAKKWKIFRLLSRLASYSHFMPNVKHCTILEKKGHRVLTHWEVEMDHVPIQWKEEEIFDPENFSISFRALDGDLEKFEGRWTLKDDPSGNTEVAVEVRFQLGIPMIDQIVGKALAEKVLKNFNAMLQGINDRLTLNRYKNISFRQVSDLKGFAVIGHPYNLQHLLRYFKFFKPDMKIPSEGFLLKLFEMAPAYKAYDILNFRSKTGKIVNGYFVMCPIIPDMLKMDLARVMEKVFQACKVAEDLGVGIVTLGGFTSIAGEKNGKALAEMVNVPVTTGNTFTVAMVLEGIRKAARLMGVDLAKAKVAIIGGAGDIGGACAKILSEEVREIVLTGRSERNLMDMQRALSYNGKAQIRTSISNSDAIQGADIIIAAASTSSAIIDFNQFKSGAVVCDVGYPKNISYTACQRKDILIFSGGISSIPSEFNLGFDIGMPSAKVLYGCFAEALLLDLEERYENFSYGKGNITKEKVEFITQIGQKHGFELAPFFWGNQLVTDSEVEQIAKMKNRNPTHAL